MFKSEKPVVQRFTWSAEGATPFHYGKILVACVLVTGSLFAATKIGWFASLVAPVIVFAGVALLYLSWRNWELGVQAVLVIVIFEGALRKWFFPSASDLVYFYKDFIMLAALVGYLSRRRKAPLLIKGRLRWLVVIIV